MAAGYHHVCGIDEAGRGPWAGPVVAVAVILDPSRVPAGLNDSKKLSEIRREALFDPIMATARVGCLSIAAASVIAKVTRDRIMLAHDTAFPQYGFARHKGYGTAIHAAALAQHGASPIHRKSFAPIAALMRR